VIVYRGYSRCADIDRDEGSFDNDLAEHVAPHEAVSHRTGEEVRSLFRGTAGRAVSR
jgi:hypothetical protein